MSTQFKFIAAYLGKAWKTRQEFLFGVIAHITHNSIRNFFYDNLN